MGGASSSCTIAHAGPETRVPLDGMQRRACITRMGHACPCAARHTAPEPRCGQPPAPCLTSCAGCNPAGGRRQQGGHCGANRQRQELSSGGAVQVGRAGGPGPGGAAESNGSGMGPLTARASRAMGHCMAPLCDPLPTPPSCSGASHRSVSLQAVCAPSPPAGWSSPGAGRCWWTGWTCGAWAYGTRARHWRPYRRWGEGLLGRGGGLGGPPHKHNPVGLSRAAPKYSQRSATILLPF